MSNAKRTIEVQGTSIAILNRDKQDYISLTDIARHRDTQEPFAIINNWMRGRSTIEFLGLWEKLSNPGFKPLEFERFKKRGWQQLLCPVAPALDRSHASRGNHFQIRSLWRHLRPS